ncbi:MAG TPA: transcription elongation factor GreA [Candidatus Deferrimicrobiaceae bacterium]|nr:transcription elongation factor GreA [Candidatus Deferrimicrobiaceae bacterium]
MTPTTPGAPDLVREVGLLADGPARWSRPMAGRGPGVYLVELVARSATAPLELARVGKWLERVPGLQLDGERPTSRALAARVASLWWPESRVLYAGATTSSLGRRVAALAAHVPGDRGPHPDGQWLHLLRAGIELRIWWAETDAPEEYLDAILDAFGRATGAALPDRPAAALALPWATTRRPTGERQVDGIAGAVLPEAPRPAEPKRQIVEIAPGDAEGARAEERGTGRVRPPRPPVTRRPPATPGRRRSPAPASPPAGSSPEPVELSPDALARLKTELDELTRVRRPEVVARIKSARELGDLRENAEYHAAREEQSFLEGRVQALEDRLRRAVVVTDQADGRVGLGSTVTVETGGEQTTFTIVGSTEANPAAGRLSAASPVGAALIGHEPGDEVDVRTPRGPVRYRVVSIA